MSILKYIPYFKRKRELDTNRAKGCMFGQSVGDALGLGSEFMCKTEVETYYPDGLTDYSQIWQDRHRRRWHKGDWTDDTDMMLCIANAIIETGKADYLVIGRTRQTLWSAVQMLTQKLCCQTIHDCPKVVPLHYESE